MRKKMVAAQATSRASHILRAPDVLGRTLVEMPVCAHNSRKLPKRNDDSKREPPPRAQPDGQQQQQPQTSQQCPHSMAPLAPTGRGNTEGRTKPCRSAPATTAATFRRGGDDDDGDDDRTHRRKTRWYHRIGGANVDYSTGTAATTNAASGASTSTATISRPPRRLCFSKSSGRFS